MRRFVVAAVLAAVSLGCDGSLPSGPTPPAPSAPSSAAPPPTPAPPPDAGPADPLVGRYTLEMRLGGGCDELPARTRHRTYDAQIASNAGGGFLVTLSGGAFLGGGICTSAPSGLGCNQFLATRDGDDVRFELRNENDDGHGGHIVEKTPDGWWIEVIGEASGRLQSDTIRASGRSGVWYCPSPMPYPFPCYVFGSCESTNTELSFRRK